MSKTKSHEDGKRFRSDTLVSIEELLSEEIFRKNVEDAILCPSMSNFFSHEVPAATVSNDKSIYCKPEDFNNLTESTSSAELKDATFISKEIFCRRMEDAESVRCSTEDYDQQYSSDFETANQAEETENAVMEFIAKKVDNIKSQRLSQKLSEKADSAAGDCQSNAIKEFFKMKVANLQQKQNEKLVSENPKESNKVDGSDKKVVPSVLVNIRNVETLKIKNLLYKMKKVSSPKFHMPAKCQRCKQANGVLAENAFLRKKITQLRKHKIEERLENHLHQDALVLIADIINSGPKPSDPPQEIWNRLLKN